MHNACCRPNEISRGFPLGGTLNSRFWKPKAKIEVSELKIEVLGIKNRKIGFVEGNRIQIGFVEQSASLINRLR